MWLRQRGVRSIVSFRPENDIDYRKFGFEHVLRLPLTRSVMPTQDQALEYLKFIQNPANQPVHIHCSAGVGRTGMMAALARYSIDGWTLDRALDEARRYRGGKELSARRMAWLRAWAKSYPPASFSCALIRVSDRCPNLEVTHAILQRSRCCNLRLADSPNAIDRAES
jgi:hypothetical protein